MTQKITKEDFKEFRNLLGFRNQEELKRFLGAKDIKPSVDFDYMENLNDRLFDIISKLNSVVNESVKIEDLESFYTQNIHNTYKKLSDNSIIEKLNNQGRRPEEVYFSWMRGFITSKYFLKALSQIYDVNIDDIQLVGDDDLETPETFKRTPKADLQVKINENKYVRLEIQSGFQGINDIKQHKVLEAQRLFQREGISSYVIHFDIFNGQVAFLRIDNIKDDDVNWITRQQMEGQTVFNIDQNYFIWRLIDVPPRYEEIMSMEEDE